MRKIKKMPRLILLSALSAIAFGGIAAGSTYALFTSSAQTKTTVTAGKVDVSATLSELTTYSGTDLTGNTTTDADKISATSENLTFSNGGTATLTTSGNTNTIKLSGLTPGDKVTFKVKVTNSSNVKTKYRSVFNCEDDTGLFSGLKIKIGEKEVVNRIYTTDYQSLDAVDTPTDVTSIPVSIELSSDSGNLYQEKECELSFKVEAIQGNAKDGVYEVSDSTTLQAYLDGQYGSIDGATFILNAGTYDKILIRPTANSGSNTSYYKEGYSAENFDATKKVSYEDIKDYTGTCTYFRSIKNVKFVAAANADVKVAGLELNSGYISGTSTASVTDPVRGTNSTSNNDGYYPIFDIDNISFENINFTAVSKTYSSLEDTSISNIYYSGCKFDINNTTANEANRGIIFQNENANQKLSNLVVYNCEFNTCWQSIYTSNIYNFTSINCKYDTTKHNAIAIQDNKEVPTNHGDVVIKNNTFKDIGKYYFDSPTTGQVQGKQVLRFRNVGSDTRIIVKNNTATNSGEYDAIKGRGMIEANSLASGIEYDITNNNWGDKVWFSHSVFEDR